MSRFTLDPFTPGPLLPAEVNSAFENLATAINNVANGGNGITEENLDVGNIPPESLATPYVCQPYPVPIITEAITSGGRQYLGQLGSLSTLEYQACVAPVDCLLDGYGFHGENVPGLANVWPHQVYINVDGVAVIGPDAQAEDTPFLSTGNAIAVLAGQTVSVTIKLGNGVNANMYNARCTVNLLSKGWR